MKTKKKFTKSKRNNQKNKAGINAPQTLESRLANPKTAPSEQPENNPKYALPINEIKKDLKRTIMFAVFAIGSIILINYVLPEKVLQLDFSGYKFF